MSYKPRRRSTDARRAAWPPAWLANDPQESQLQKPADFREIPRPVPFRDVASEIGERLKIKALATDVDGVLYRSRLEARWATFFSTAGILFSYEPEGYDLGEGLCYLVDFWLPTQKIWIEVKPEPPSPLESTKAMRLAMMMQRPVFIFYGPFANQFREECMIPAMKFFPDATQDDGYFWCECPQCGWLGIEFEARAGRLPCKCHKRNDRTHNGHSDILTKAYRAARTRRFVQ